MKPINITKIVFTLGVICLLAVACAPKKAGPSGFLGDYRTYGAMYPNDKWDGVKEVWTPDIRIAQYQKFIVMPVQVYLSPEAKKKNLKPEELQELAQVFTKTIKKVLGKKYQIVSRPGRNTAVIRAAITDVNANFVLLNIHPGTVITGAGRGGASFEAELLDSRTMQRLVAVMDTSKGKPYKYTSGFTKWGHAKSVMTDWTNRLVKRLEQS